MAEQNSNILKLLQELELSPSANAFEKAWGNILLQKQGTVNSEEASKNIFSKLQDFSLQAPPLDFISIVAGKNPAAAKKNSPFISKNLLRVAAILAIAITGVILFMAAPPKTGEQQNNGNQLASGQGIKNNGQAAKNITNPSLINNPASGNETSNSYNANALAAKENAIKNKNSSGSSVTARKVKGVGKNSYGKPGSFYNNDFFLTLVNYTEYGKEKLFTKTLKEKKITLNQYSYINLSDKMVEMLQEIYMTKKNGKPSRKAKKAKKKFEKWRKSDEDFFDKNLNKNPADIIDLSEFLMNE